MSFVSFVVNRRPPAETSRVAPETSDSLSAPWTTNRAAGETHRDPHVLTAILFPAMAAGMGWGIRGQYGHETGAMIAGVLAALALILIFVPHVSSLAGARAAALMAIAIGVGGSMTYGQTVGLTHDRPLIGNWEAWRWGMLGLAIKGGLWIGLAGVFLGMGLGGVRYRFQEMVVVMLALLGLYFVGVRLLNEPFDPEQKALPKLYFSDNWLFEPGVDLKPRREVWGGNAMAWLALTAYAGVVRRDRLAWRLSLWACLGGALGFPIGQCLQSYHAWNAEAFAASSWSGWFRHFNWWNMMETTFGAIWGGVLGFGLWRHRRLIPKNSLPDEVSLTPAWEVALCSLHVVALLAGEIVSLPEEPLAAYLEIGLLMTIIPIACCTGGRFWPYAMLLPVAAAPIIQKSMFAFCYGSPKMTLTTGWIFIVALPTATLLYAVAQFVTGSYQRRTTRNFAAVALLLTTWLYFGLNTTFFDFAWPWRAWTARTPNQLLFMGCAIGLSGLSIVALLRDGKDRVGRSAIKV